LPITKSTIVSFIQKRGFTYIDVQTEVLDHVACRVEEILDQDPELSLEAAIQKTHSEFGIFGFSAVEDAIISGLTKKYNRLFWRTFLSFFGPRYILLLLFCVFAVYKIQAFVQSITFMYILAATALITAIVYLFKYNRPAYKNYLAYRLSMAYFIGLGSFCSLLMLVIDESQPLLYPGVHAGYAGFTAIAVCFAIYMISAVQTAKHGIQTAEEIRQKYEWIKA
jgi:hypothetical protein